MSNPGRSSQIHRLDACILPSAIFIAVVWCNGATGVTGALIEEVIVTAQRVEENLQKVPIAASAFNEAMIEDRQIIGLADLQVRVPNLSYNDQAFGRGRFNIRGIGRQNDQPWGEEGIAIHINGVPAPAETRVELYDMDRLEVLRGPQGTLYGRNATGGTINMIFRQPSEELTEGYIEFEYGDYDHRRLEAAFNLPIGDRVAFRAAGMGLTRDGFTENLAGHQVQEVDDDLDGRDLWSGRVTAKWWISDTTSMTVYYSRFEEDDDRLRYHAVVCKQNPEPTLGCVPGEFGFDVMHPIRGFGWATAFIGGRPLGAFDADSGLIYEFPRPRVDFRHQHTDFEPIFERQEDMAGAEFNWSGERYSFTFSGGHFDQDYVSYQDDHMDVGDTLQSPAVPDGFWPISAPSGTPGTGPLRRGRTCNVNDGTAGIRGGCVWKADLTRHFAYQPSGFHIDQTAAEARLHSHLDSAVNFLIGTNYLRRDRAAETYRFDNLADQLALIGSFTPGFFNVYNEEEFETYSAFGEAYWQIAPDWKVTAGLRYNRDKKSIVGAFAFELDGVAIPGSDPASPEFIRNALLSWWTSGVPTPEQRQVATLYGASEAIDRATDDEARLHAFQLVPLSQGLNENALLAGRPADHTWHGVTGRLGVTWTPTNQHMLYAFYTRGYKPGGFGRGSDAMRFDAETVDAIEFGTKNRLLNGSMVANLAVFWNDHSGLQVDDGLDPGNFDARSWGAELELEWRPEFLPNLHVTLLYGWLHSELDHKLSFDRRDPLQNNPDYVVLNSFPQEIYVAPRAAVENLAAEAIATGAASGLPSTLYPDGLPSIVSRPFLVANGVETLAGFPVDITDNKIPFAPEQTIGAGLGYRWHFNAGSVHVRWDYYRRGRSYSRVFNVRALDAWEQHDVSLAFENASGRWTIKAWVRNLNNEVAVNNNSFEFGTTGGAMFYQVNDPRLYGASVRVTFGTL